MVGQIEPGAGFDMTREREVSSVQVLHADELTVSTHGQGQAPMRGRELGSLCPPPGQRCRGEPVRCAGGEWLLMPVMEKGHGLFRRLNAASDQVDELGEVVVTQDPELNGAAGDK